MATKLQLGTGQLDMNTVADKLNTANNLIAMNARLGGPESALPVIFPLEFHSFDYLRFSGTSFPFTCNDNAQDVDTNITCYGTPVFSSSVGWMTVNTYGLTAGFRSAEVSVTKNTGAERTGTLTVTVTQPLGTYSISTTLVQDAVLPPFEAISLGFDVSEGNTAACEDFVFAPATYYINPAASGSFTAATGLRRGASGINAALGWYSNGSVARYWNGASFTSQENCTI